MSDEFLYEVLIVAGPHTGEMLLSDRTHGIVTINEHPYRIYSLPGTKTWLLGASAWKDVPGTKWCLQIARDYIMNAAHEPAGSPR
jgi:hypothetical protein